MLVRRPRCLHVLMFHSLTPLLGAAGFTYTRRTGACWRGRPPTISLDAAACRRLQADDDKDGPHSQEGVRGARAEPVDGRRVCSEDVPTSLDGTSDLRVLCALLDL